MGYSKKAAEMVIAFLKTQGEDSQFKDELKVAVRQLERFVKTVLKPRYIAKTLNHLLALIDISIELRETSIYLIKHLFNPLYEDGRMRVAYAYLERVSPDCYKLAYLKDNGEYKITHHEINLSEAIKILEAHPLYAP